MGWFCVLRIGVSDLHHSDGTIGAHPGNAVNTADDGIAAENVGPTILAAEDGPLGEYRQTVKGGRMHGTGDGVCLNLIVEGYIDAIMVAIEGHGFYIYIGIEELGVADPGAGGGIQHFLGALS